MVGIRIALTVCVMTVAATIVAEVPVAAQQADRGTRFDRAPLLKEPSTPDELFAATLTMVDLIRNDLALPYLEQFMAGSPDDETLIRLRDKHGVGDFVKLARTKDLQPLSTQLLRKLNSASKKQASDPAFVDVLIDRLLNDPKRRDEAMAELRNAGPQVIPEMLKRMSQPEMAEHQDQLAIALIKLGNQAIPALIGALEWPQESVRGAIIDVLGWLDAKEAIPFLWFPAFDSSQPEGINVIARKTLTKLLKGSELSSNQLSSIEATNELRRLAKLYYRTTDALPLDHQGQVTFWNYNRAAETIVEQSLPPDVASLALSTRFARQAVTLSPEQPETQRQYLAALLGLEVLRQGWDKPRVATPDSALYLALTAGESMMAQVLAEALEAGQPTTAVAALEVLGQTGSREQLASQSGLKSPVIAALNSPDQRVQFAAATTILKLDPKTPFSGVSRVVEILARSLTDPTEPRAIVIDSDKKRATVTTGYLFDGGYEAVPTLTGREGFERAATLTGINIIVVHVNCARWELNQTLANLRADARTAAIPLAIYGPSKLSEDLERLVARNAPAVYLTESSTSDDFMSQLRPYLKTVKSPPLSNQERALQKNAAIYWLSVIGSTDLAKVFDIAPAEKELSAIVDDPAIAINGLIALGSISTRPVQQRLASQALNPLLDEVIRETAANQLAFHIQRHGLLLDRDEVNEVQQSWKSTENVRVKSALASVIGTLRPSAQAVGERLRQFPLPSLQ